jgi:hypothetical protein
MIIARIIFCFFSERRRGDIIDNITPTGLKAQPIKKNILKAIALRI